MTFNISSSRLSCMSSLFDYLSISFLSSRLRFSSSILCSIAFRLSSLARDSSSRLRCLSAYYSCCRISNCFSCYFFFLSSSYFFSRLSCFTKSLACFLAFSYYISFSLRLRLMSSAGSPLMMAISSSILLSSSKIAFFSLSINSKLRLSLWTCSIFLFYGCSGGE